MRRSASHAKIVEKHERRKAHVKAKASSARFGSKQSRFQLRQEELLVQNALQPDKLSTFPSLQLGSTEAVSGLQHLSSFGRSGRQNVGVEKGRFTTASTPTFGLAHPQHARVSTTDSRSARRAAKFRLDDDDQDLSREPSQLFATGLLGASSQPMGVGDNNNNSEGGNDSGEPQRKKTREERFQEVLANSKDHRAQAQRDRAELAQQTSAVDAEFKDVLHLLKRRDKVQEEREDFANTGNPEMREFIRSYRENHVARVLTLKGDGSFTVAPLAENGLATGGKSGISCLSDGDIALLQKIDTDEVITKEKKENYIGGCNERKHGHHGHARMEEDDFDRLMQSMRFETQRAIAGDRTLTEAEELALRDQQELLEADRADIPLRHEEEPELTRSEWLDRGGEQAYRMDEDDEVEGEAEDLLDISSACESDEAQLLENLETVTEGNNVSSVDVDRNNTGTGISTGAAARLEELLAEMESFSREASESHMARAERSHTYHGLLQRFYRYAREHVLHTAQIFRCLLIEAQHTFLRRGLLDQTTLLLLHTISRIFPMTDYRHEVVTPFLIFLSSTLLQMRLKTLEHVRQYAVLAGVLCESLLAGGKFCAEAIIAPLNIIALQVPRSVLEPVRLQGLCVPFPLVERGEVDSVLLCTANDCTDVADDAAPLQGTLAVLERDVSCTRLVRYAYRLLSLLADVLRGVPAFAYCLEEPFRALHTRLAATDTWQVSASVRSDHNALLSKLTQLSTDARDRRAPLAMRSFRPRPIRQFEPLLQEGTTTALKSEVRTMKREMREDHKRVVRHLQAEANVERRQRERAAEAEEAQRDKKYRELMASLQTQQHVMNRVDGLLEKARSKKRERITGRAGGNSADGEAQE